MMREADDEKAEAEACGVEEGIVVLSFNLLLEDWAGESIGI